uniref:Uncharacterized protein LOC104219963 n=1 Tax=Nicotiana sylvestris TaxID=4096 RepID=A0A1U7VM46_NICSY|nr:PREDICTED: uncharacterized protein LOC104219963 [Nicotiana sylvestris]
MRLDISESNRVLACVVSRSSLFKCIKVRQYNDTHLLVPRDMVQHDDSNEVTIGDDGVLRLQGRIYVPNVDGLQELILKETYCLRCSIHPRAMKMYHDLRQHYYWRNQGTQVTPYFWRSTQRELGTQRVMRSVSSSVHLQQQLSVEYPYGSYKALYGRRYCSSFGWFEPGEARLLGTNLVCDALEMVKLIKERAIQA